MKSTNSFVVPLLLFSIIPVFCGASETPDYQRDIRQILSDKCYACHGPDEQSREADLRLDRRENALHVLSPDTPAESELLLRIVSQDPDVRMPPPDSKMSLSSAEIKILKQWIEASAPFEQHWSFQPLGSISPPQVKAPPWVTNPIDAFVLDKLERAEITPAAEAKREQLIRRVSFDLTGLPPTLEEIRSFRNDQSPNAYERMVDSFLEKPQYGERMAATWLDIARYSDTYGYQVDRDRFVWPWRDWVIKAFNDNMPYDQFILKQLAGDLLPNATDQDVLATTFNRLHPQKVEGGSTPEEFRVEYVADRNHTFATAFLGLTLECARCHDHKYDPITQSEYYQFFAFFNTIDEAGLYSYFTSSVPTPTLLLGDEATRRSRAEAEQLIVDAERDLDAWIAKRHQPFEAWLSERPQQAEMVGQVAHRSFDEPMEGANHTVEGRFDKAVRMSGDDGISLKVGNFSRNHPFTVSLWMRVPDVKERAVVFHRSRAWTDAGSRGYQLLLEDGKLSASLIHFWPGNAIRVRSIHPVAVNEWTHVVMSYDGSSTASGLKLFVGGMPADVDQVRDNLYKNITGGGGDNIVIGQRFRDRGFTDGEVDEFRVFDRELTEIEVAQLFDGKTLERSLQTPLDRLTESQRQALFEFYLATVDPEYKERLASLRELRQSRSKMVDGVQEIMVMREMTRPRATYRLERGAYDAPAEEVIADTPDSLPEFPAGQPRNRLGLARWLIGSNHALTSRVAVNRLWQQCFGQGLVRTPEDFGSQGEIPSHQELLDWLAFRFVESGWDVKQLLKLMVMSSTYRQSSVAGDLMEIDPENLLLARSPTYRRSAEMIRDNALAVSGLLEQKVGGAPVKPYEVAVSFKPLKRDSGKGLYRRSLYTFWKRTAPAPVMMTLDAAKREVCVVKRERTSSPLQALVLLNDPQFVEAARVMAERLLQKLGDEPVEIVREAFEELTSRAATEQEVQILIRLWDQQLKYFQANPKRTIAFLQMGDSAQDESLNAASVAAAASVMSTLLNYDECVVKR
ncbi:MAG: DUF1553 domain-containing protein [Planctomycetaceae bacterium]|nr:DUF1553 domain-containing protein [Planctomycetaceae bacterium]